MHYFGHRTLRDNVQVIRNSGDIVQARIATQFDTQI